MYLRYRCDECLQQHQHRPPAEPRLLRNGQLWAAARRLAHTNPHTASIVEPSAVNKWRVQRSDADLVGSSCRISATFAEDAVAAHPKRHPHRCGESRQNQSGSKHQRHQLQCQSIKGEARRARSEERQVSLKIGFAAESCDAKK